MDGQKKVIDSLLCSKFNFTSINLFLVYGYIHPIDYETLCIMMEYLRTMKDAGVKTFPKVN